MRGLDDDERSLLAEMAVNPDREPTDAELRAAMRLWRRGALRLALSDRGNPVAAVSATGLDLIRWDAMARGLT